MMWLYLILGLMILAFSGDMLVRGAVDLSKLLKISPFIIAGTLVAFGTSAPELFVSLEASSEGSPGAALGNILGSNFANVFLALGMAALIQVIKMPNNMQSADIIILLVSTVVFVFVLLNISAVSKWLGFAFIITLLLYVFFTLKNNKEDNLKNTDPINISIQKSSVFFILGLIGVVLGSDLLVKGAIDIAKNFGIREAIIGVGVLAFGTSLPELATSVIAAIKKESNIAIGNIVGSSIFNILAIGGATLLASNKYDLENTVINIYDLFPFILATLILVLFFKFKFTITKLYGFFLVIFYILWITFIFLS